MTDPDERDINRAIVLVENLEVRGEARAALHRLFRDRRNLEQALKDHGCGSGCTFPTHPYRSVYVKEQEYVSDGTGLA